MSEIPLREAGDLPLQVWRDLCLQPSGVRPVHLIRCRQSGTRGYSAALQPRDEGDEMDGDRPMVDGRDIFESRIQDAVRRPRKFVFDWYRDVFLSDDDGETSNVGSQDETSEERTLGNGVRSEDDLTETFPYTIFICKGDTLEYNLAKCETLLEAKKISDICNRMLFIQGYGYTGDDIQKYRISVRDSKSRYVY